MTEEQISNCKEILKVFIFKIRDSIKGGGVFDYVFHYYNNFDDDILKTYSIGTKEYYQSFDFFRTKRQIKKRILSNKNNYWNLDESKIKILESFCINNSDEFDNLFKEYIEYLWNCDINKQKEEFERQEQELREKDEDLLKIVLKNKYSTYKDVIPLILNDTKEYPYKSDKIKILLDLELDVETIFLILQTKEKWSSPRGYINKYFEERKEKIKNKKIVVYELNSLISHVINQLK